MVNIDKLQANYEKRMANKSKHKMMHIYLGPIKDPSIKAYEDVRYEKIKANRMKSKRRIKNGELWGKK